jgi:hypothetical protein
MPKTANHKTIVGIRDKLDKKEYNEIRDGAISTLYQKLRNKIIKPEEITHTKHKKIVGSILEWIKDRQLDTKSSTDKNRLVQHFIDSIKTLSIIANSNSKGQSILKRYGSQEFFVEFKKDSFPELYSDIDSLLTNLVKDIAEEDNQENISNYSNMSYANEPSYRGTVTEDECRSMRANSEIIFEESINDRDLNTKFGNFYQHSNIPDMTRQVSFGLQTSEVEQDSSSFKINTSKDFQNSQFLRQESRNINLSSNYNPEKEEQKADFNREQSIAISQKPQSQTSTKNNKRWYVNLEKEKCELPHIKLAKDDENLISDLAVRMRYGDFKNHTEASRSLETHIFQDFPLEVFLQNTEIIENILEVIVQTVDQRIFNNWVCVLLKFIENAVPLYKYLLSPYNRFCEISSYNHNADQEPLNNIERWREIKFNPDALSSSTYGSWSLSFMLWEIATKVLDWPLHEGKMGGAFVVYRAIINAISKIYDIYEAEEFADIFIKLLNNFDFILTSISMGSIKIDPKSILLHSIPTIQIANSIFNSKEYRSDPDKYHPKTKILISSTLKLQQDLRKGLFDMTFSPEEINVVLEFFEHKSKLDKKDEYLIASYYRAQEAIQVYKLAWNFRIKTLDCTDNDESEITSESEFLNLLEIMQQLLVCIELCLEFPFESCLLNLIEYSELMENSGLESHLDEVISLFWSYVKLPLEEVRGRVINK